MPLSTITDTGLTGPALWLVVAGLGVVAVLFASVRSVAADQQAVVRRFGRVVRVAGPGLVFRVPGIDRVTTVPRLPVRLPLVVSTLSRDGLPVRLIATVVCRIADPARSSDPFGTTAATVEDALTRQVGQTTLADLLAARAEAENVLPGRISEVTAAWGVEVLEIEVTDIETRWSSDLLRVVGQDADRNQ
ncbi:SPFH domain/Band 7 family protein [Kribbella amoyensis]|uniref:SPFH domain/Band 7 family protein n=1 Tax=Kribbella amoyensis TaxID=996641 RepID=A0A561BM35_9ACTN|nr:SPFH domain-containing protein [Kribbella amoyensis]TWD79877.1 SPFH domain/Band 7 family protein [Kribbella amoyensis]